MLLCNVEMLKKKRRKKTTAYQRGMWIEKVVLLRVMERALESENPNQWMMGWGRKEDY